ncbi:MAG TPA: alpha/beta fold hydrolase [Actinomycetota bacterium]|nr:alpha/beta fold hydrolase [Actinomycetota bacterium]
MSEVSNQGVKICYDVAGQGRPLVLLHGWICDRSWWTEPGYVDALRRDHRLINVDVRGHGASNKPHEAARYTWDALAGDVFAVVAAEGLDRFAIWGQSMGGYIAWMMAATAPERVAAIVTTGAWDPRPKPKDPMASDEWVRDLRRRGTSVLVEGETFDRQSPPWPQAVILRNDPEALIASGSAEMWTDGIIPDEALRSFPVPALLLADELEDENDDAAKVAAMIPNGQSLRLPGIGHGGAMTASALTVPHARAFLKRWIV